jgi:excisionase family DNA binding protein
MLDIATTSRLITLDDAAALLGVHPRTVRRYIKRGLIPGYQIGPRLVKLDAADLDKLIRPIPIHPTGLL